MVQLIARSDGLNAEMREAFALAQRLPEAGRVCVLALIHSMADQYGIQTWKKPRNIGKSIVGLTGDDREGRNG